jgi:hypothetical protein
VLTSNATSYLVPIFFSFSVDQSIALFLFLFWEKIIIILNDFLDSQASNAASYVPGSFTARQKTRPSIITATIAANFDNSILQVGLFLLGNSILDILLNP